jgi:hypothetical protein
MYPYTHTHTHTHTLTHTHSHSRTQSLTHAPRPLSNTRLLAADRIPSAVPYDAVIRAKIVSNPDFFVRWKVPQITIPQIMYPEPVYP